MVCGDSASLVPPMPGLGGSSNGATAAEAKQPSSLSMQPMMGRGLLGSPGAQPSAVAPALSGPGLPAPPPPFQARR